LAVFKPIQYIVYMGLQRGHSVCSNKRRHVGGIPVHQCNVANFVGLCAELYASRNVRSANNLGKRIVRYPHLAQSLFVLIIPPTWRRAM